MSRLLLLLLLAGACCAARAAVTHLLVVTGLDFGVLTAYRAVDFVVG